MRVKLTLSLLCLAFASGCAGTPQWDTSVFPHELVYDGSSPATTADAKSTK